MDNSGVCSLTNKLHQNSLTTDDVSMAAGVSFRGEISTCGCLHGNSKPASSRLAALRRVAVFAAMIDDC